MISISNGILKNAVRCVIYGTEGIGKTTLASKAPGAVFVDLENGTARMNVNRIECIDTWEKLFALPAEILKHPNPFSICRTLVIDTADRADEMCIEYICQKHEITGIEDIGYGKGYVYAAEEFDRFLGELDNLMAAGINIILTSHSYLRKQELPHEEGSFDRYELKLSKKIAPIVKEWCDMLLFCTYREFVVESEKTKTKKVSGGQRVIYTEHHPCWDAKNRFGLPNPMDMNFTRLEPFFTDVLPFGEQLKKNPVTPQMMAEKAAEQSRRASKKAMQTAQQTHDAETVTSSDTESDTSDTIPDTADAAPTLSESRQKLKEMIEQSGFTEEQVIQIAISRGRCEEGSTLKDLPDSLIKQWFLPNWERIISTIK